MEHLAHSTITHVLSLLVGLGLLVKCSDWLVDGAVWAARRLGVSPFAVGLTIIAYGTSLPEAVVSTLAGLQGSSDFAIGNIVGSNIANIGLVLGVTAIVAPICMSRSGTLFKVEFPWLVLSTIGVVLLVYFSAFGQSEATSLSLLFIGIPILFGIVVDAFRKDWVWVVVGVLLVGVSAASGLRFIPLEDASRMSLGLVILFASIYYTREVLTSSGIGHHLSEFVSDPEAKVRESLDSIRLRFGYGGKSFHTDPVLSIEPRPVEPEENSEQVGWGKIALFLAIGFVGLVGGAQLLVFGGTELAKTAGISERIIALTIVAVGTSLPELAASIAAARRGEPELAVGNVVGSCLFNLTFVLGAAALVAPISIGWAAVKVDMLVLCGFTAFMFGFLWTDSKLSRREGVVLLSLYVIFMSYVGWEALSSSGPAMAVGVLGGP